MRRRVLNRWLKSVGVVMVLMLAALFSVLPAARASACACCSEPGVWYERTDAVSSYELSEINRLRFDAVAHTYMTEAGEDSIEGIRNPSDEYSMTLSKRQRRWELRFRDKQGRTGTLAFNVPASLVEFAADIHDSQESSGGGPLLYKEWRLTGAVTGTGAFKGGSTPQTKFRLVFQGRGNFCTSAETFDNWQLQIFGPRASYSFYGKFKDPTPAQNSRIQSSRLKAQS